MKTNNQVRFWNLSSLRLHPHPSQHHNLGWHHLHFRFLKTNLLGALLRKQHVENTNDMSARINNPYLLTRRLLRPQWHTQRLPVRRQHLLINCEDEPLLKVRAFCIVMAIILIYLQANPVEIMVCLMTLIAIILHVPMVCKHSDHMLDKELISI